MDHSTDFELAKQLHEQFAINENKRNNYVLSFISAISFVLTGFGFACWYFSECHSLVFVGISLATGLILTLLSFISTHLGYSIRRDQIIISRIRKVYMNEEYDKLFKNLYNPIGKKCVDFLISLYKIYVVFFIIMIVGVAAMSIVILSESNPNYIRFVLITFAIFIICIILNVCNYYNKYKNIAIDT